jgi:membrane-associated phospholipid phosphatase
MVVGALVTAAALLCWSMRLDLPLHRLFRAPDEAWIVPFSALGGLAVMGPIGLAATAWLLIRRRGAEALWLFVTVGSGRLVVEGIKLLVRRPRPPLADRLELVTSWSFPSSHSAGTMMTCLALALLSGGSGAAAAVAALCALAIGWSRVALAVHWPSDVLAGWGFGLVWLGLAARWQPARERSRVIGAAA